MKACYNKKPRLYVTAILVVIFSSCVSDRDFDLKAPKCAANLEANATYKQVKDLYDDQTIQIQEDLIITGYVVSSDEKGNFFSVLHFQDAPSNPTEGFQIEIDLRNAHLFYPVGSKIIIKLKGLYLGKSREVYKIGGVFTSFGNVSVGRLPNNVVGDHVLLGCDQLSEIQPREITIPEISAEMAGTLIQLQNMEVSLNEVGEPYAFPREETARTLLDCEDNVFELLNSGFSDFQSEVLPDGSGTITGVLLRSGNDYTIAIRSLDDVLFKNDRCPDFVDEFTSSNIFFSELADPDNNTGARFVELYNSAKQSLSLKGWTIRRYTNANVETSSILDLSDVIIEGEQTLVISPDKTEFEAVYGFSPDVAVGSNSPADSNGDDNLELVDPFGVVVDVFGVVGEDGSGTSHEFEDGRAVRNSSVIEGNPVYSLREWLVFNDTGDAGTINQPQNAPQDFTPGSRE